MRKLSISLIMFVYFLAFVVFGCASETKTLKVSPSKIDFGNINIGDYLETDVEITNKYGKDVIITDISIVGNNDFQLMAGATIPINLSNNNFHPITIRFTPTSNIPVMASLNIIHDASVKPKTADILGTGVKVARIELLTTNYDFGAVLYQTTEDHDFDITNIGTNDLSISSFYFTGAAAALYSVSTGGNTPVNVTPGSTHTFTVQFAPLTAAIYPANLEISHNAVNVPSPSTISLTGEGVITAPEITFSNASPWDCGTASTVFPVLKELEIENTGTDALTVTSAAFNTGVEFQIKEVQDTNGNVVNLPQVVVVGNKIKIVFEFKPATTNNFNDDLVFVHDAVNIASPYNFEVTGTGRATTQETFDYSGSIENWIVPAGIIKVRIEVWGAQGGSASTASGGKGARMRGDFDVNPGDTIKVLAGQQGGNSNNPNSSGWSGGGGGGSYVATNTNQPLICAGGGGGAGVMNSSPQNVAIGDDGVITRDGTRGKGNMPPGTNGNGAPNQSNTGATGGAGFLTDSANYPSGWGGPARAFVNGGAGAIQTMNSGNGGGGFGGGGAGAFGGGGGGGYSGGAHGHFTPTRDLGAGGGGSINNGTDKDNTPGVQSGNGRVVISY